MMGMDPVRFEGYLADIVVELKRLNANLGSIDSSITGVDEETQGVKREMALNTSAILGIKNSLPDKYVAEEDPQGFHFVPTRLPQQLVINFGKEEE